MRTWWLSRRYVVLMLVIAMATLVLPLGGRALAQETTEEPDTDATDTAAVDATDGPTLESQVVNYLHFALVGRFDIADQLYGAPLVSRPELNPLTDAAAEELIAITDERPDTIETLFLIINNSSIGDNAQKLINLIREAHKRKRMDPARIEANIELLRGDPMQRKVGLELLMDSGEYAVPWMLGVLTDPDRKADHPFVARALPQLGRNAITPLAAALAVPNEAMLQVVIESLGKIGYPQALPYLQRIATDNEAPAQVRSAATEAIELIIAENADAKVAPADVLFRDLAEDYYANVDSLRPDPREDQANVWVARADALPAEDVVAPIAVPSEIYNLVMCMNSCGASLQLNADQPATAALWLAANFRREARLGLDVQSDETIDARVLDASRPEEFPRSIYFARLSGPLCCQIALARATKDRDRDVALGAVSALTATAARQAMVAPKGPGGSSLGEAVAFPDLLVRVEAALALGLALPTESFRGSTEVVPVLASVLSPTDKSYYMLVDPDNDTRAVIETGLANSGAEVVAAQTMTAALLQARKTLTHLDAVFLASDLRQPAAIEAIRQLAKDDRFGLAPVMVLVKQNDSLIVDRVAELDGPVGTVFVVADDEGKLDDALVDQMLAKKDQIALRFGHHELTPEVRLALAMRSALTLTNIAAHGSNVFDVPLAESALVDTLRAHDSEPLRIAVAATLSWLDSSRAQRAITEVALDDTQTDTLRMATFALLADSARRFDSLLDGDLNQQLISQAVGEPNLMLRTAASQALGAMNLPIARIVPVIAPAGG